MSKPSYWTIELIEKGINRYLQENGKYPSATDFDEVDYLPSARQVQRVFGGLESLRTTLGLPDVNFTKGAARRVIAMQGYERGLNAEDLLEAQLIDYFGEPFVHTQKRYYKLLKNRYDFFVYYDGGYFGVDIFSPTKRSYIAKNVYHKIKKYAEVPASIPIFFVVDADHVTTTDIEAIYATIAPLKNTPSIRLMLTKDFLSHIYTTYRPLELPHGFIAVL